MAMPSVRRLKLHLRLPGDALSCPSAKATTWAKLRKGLQQRLKPHTQLWLPSVVMEPSTQWPKQHMGWPVRWV